MVKSSHLKRLFAPKTWQIKRKNITFIVRPSAGAHSMDLSIPLKLVLMTAGLATTMREVTYMLHNHDIQVEMKKRRDPAFPVGIFDIISCSEIKKSFTIIIDKQGKISVKEIDFKLKNKLVKISGKKNIRGSKSQLFTKSGKTILINDKELSDYTVGDSLLIELPSQKIIKHFPLKENSKIYLIKGLHAGKIANLEKINNNVLICKSNDTIFETKKDYAFVIDDNTEKIINS